MMAPLALLGAKTGAGIGEPVTVASLTQSIW